MIKSITGHESSYTVNNDTAQIQHSGRIYPVADGHVLFVGTTKGIYWVTIQHDSGECTRYGLSTCNVAANDYVKSTSVIGTVKKYVYFEYCTEWQGESLLPVRIYKKTYYKQSPNDILNGLYSISSYVYKDDNISGGTIIKLTDAQKKEFLNSRGDDIVEF